MREVCRGNLDTRAGSDLEDSSTAAGGYSSTRTKAIQVAAISSEQFDIEVTAKCGKDMAVFQITNLGDKWPRLGKINIYKIDSKTLLSNAGCG